MKKQKATKAKGSGNLWDGNLVYSCEHCGEGNLCDVCHEHDEPRGECSECPAGSEVKTVYVRDPSEYSPPSTREQLPPHVELTPVAIRAWYNRDKT